MRCRATCSSVTVLTSRSTWSSSTLQKTIGLPTRMRARERRRVRHGDPNAPRGHRGARHGAAAHDGLASLHVRVLEVAAERLAQPLRTRAAPTPAARAASGARAALGLRLAQCIARTCSRAATCILSTRTARAIGWRAEPGDQVGPASDQPGLGSAQQLVARGTSPGRRRRRGRVGDRGLVGGHAPAPLHQSRSHVVEPAGSRAAPAKARGPWWTPRR